jgi:hypothetical protein
MAIGPLGDLHHMFPSHCRKQSRILEAAPLLGFEAEVGNRSGAAAGNMSASGDSRGWSFDYV